MNMSINGSSELSNSMENIWIVVYVQNGIPVDVKVFRNKDMAFDLALKLREDINPDMDRVSVFEFSLPNGVDERISTREQAIKQ
jgi:hypothetical protein